MDAHVELDPELNRIFLRVEYYVGVSQDCKAIPGYKWHPDIEGKPWSYPARMQTCHALRKVFGKKMTIGPFLTEWARKNARAYARQRSLASKPDSDLAKVKAMFPAFWDAMSSRPYQRSGAEFLATTGHTADFSEPGLGKTATSLAALIQAGVFAGGRHLVIVSNKTAIRSTWRHEIEKWTPGAHVYPMPDGWQKREQELDKFWADNSSAAKFVVCLPHMLQIKQERWCKKCKQWANDPKQLSAEHYGESHKVTTEDYRIDWQELFSIEWDSIIADEAHDYLLKLRPGQSKNQPQWAIGMRRLQVKQGGVKLPMTGTPMRGKEQNLFGILYWIDPIRFSSFWAWAGAYFDVVNNEYNQTVGKLRPEMEEAFYDVIDSLCLRRTLREVRKDLPPQLPQEHWVPLDGEHRRQYEEFEAEGVVALESGVLEGLGTLSELTRLRQLAFGPWDVEIDQDDDKQTIKMVEQVEKSPKVQLMMDMLRERGIPGDVFTQQRDAKDARKFIIASQYTQIIGGLERMFSNMGIATLSITGKVTGSKRSAAVTSFQKPGGPRILLINTKAGGASLTLDAYCDEMFILDETWIHDDQVQLMGRINNRGQRIATRIYHFFRTEETIDEGIAMGNDDQNQMQSMILDSRRGNQVALRLLKRRE